MFNRRFNVNCNKKSFQIWFPRHFSEYGCAWQIDFISLSLASSLAFLKFPFCSKKSKASCLQILLLKTWPWHCRNRNRPRYHCNLHSAHWQWFKPSVPFDVLLIKKIYIRTFLTNWCVKTFIHHLSRRKYIVVICFYHNVASSFSRSANRSQWIHKRSIFLAFWVG